MRRLLLTVALFVPVTATAQIPTPLPAIPVGNGAVRDSLETLAMFLPTRAQRGAQKFWQDDGTVLSSGTVLFEDKVLGASIELVSDVVGWFRFGLGITAAASTENGGDDEAPTDAEPTDGSTAAITRLASAGGVVRVTAAAPLLYRRDKDFRSTWAVLLNLAGGTESPANAGFLEDPALSGQAGLELFYQREGVADKIHFQFGATGVLYGFSDSYATKANTARTTGALFVPRVGLVILKNTRIDVLWRVGRSEAFRDLGKLAVTLQQVSS